MITNAVSLHPIESLTTTLYVPAPRLETEMVVSPVLQEYVYGEYPVLMIAVAVPAGSPAQRIFVELEVTERIHGTPQITAGFISKGTPSQPPVVQLPVVPSPVAVVVADKLLPPVQFESVMILKQNVHDAFGQSSPQSPKLLPGIPSIE